MKKASRKMYVCLSETDRSILNSYCVFAEGLCSYLGNAYEIVVQSFGEGDPFILRSVNGGMTWKIADGMLPDTLYNAVEQLQACHKRGELPFSESYAVRPDGRKTRFTSIGIIGSENKLIGMLNINFWIGAPFADVIRTFAFPGFMDAPSLPLRGADSGQYNLALKQEVERIKDAVMADPSVPAKFKRKEIVRQLNDAGIFKVKNAIQICADTLDITIATIYMHIRNLEAN